MREKGHQHLGSGGGGSQRREQGVKRLPAGALLEGSLPEGRPGVGYAGPAGLFGHVIWSLA